MLLRRGGNRRDRVERAFLERPGRREDRPVPDVVLLDDVEDRLEQQVAAVEPQANDFLDLVTAENLGLRVNRRREQEDAEKQKSVLT